MRAKMPIQNWSRSTLTILGRGYSCALLLVRLVSVTLLDEQNRSIMKNGGKKQCLHACKKRQSIEARTSRYVANVDRQVLSFCLCSNVWIHISISIRKLIILFKNWCQVWWSYSEIAWPVLRYWTTCGGILSKFTHFVVKLREKNPIFNGMVFVVRHRWNKVWATTSTSWDHLIFLSSQQLPSCILIVSTCRSFLRNYF